MALSVVTQPPQNVLAKDPVVYCFQADNLIATPGTSATITFTYPAAGDAGTTTYFTINWGNGNISTVLLPARPGATSDADYTALMILAAETDPYIAFNCTVYPDGTSNTKFYITTNNPGYPNVAITASSLPIGGWLIQTVAGTAATYNNTNIAAAVLIEDDYLSGNFQNKTPKPLLYPINSTTQTCCIDVSKILSQYLLANNNMPDVPACNQSSITQNTVTNKRYQVKFYQQTNNTPGIVGQTQIARAIYGGMGFLNQYYNQHPIVNGGLRSGQFLTHMPTDKITTTCAPEYLTYYVESPSTTAIYVQVTAYDPNTSITFGATNLEATNVQQGETYLIPVNPQVTNVIGALPNATHYTITITDQTNTPISETRTYHIAPHTKITRYFMLLNSLGGIDTIITDTDRLQTITSGIQEGIRSVPWNYTPYEGLFYTFQPSINRQYALQTDFTRRCDAEYFQELILQNGWMCEVKYCGCCTCPDPLDGCIYIPIIVTNDLKITEDDGIFRINWQYKEAFSSTSYNIQDCTQPIPPDGTTPVAVPDVYTVENCTTDNLILNLLANDYDPDGQPLTITAITQPDDGAVTIIGNGIVSYTPDPGFTGTNTFTYTISDPDGNTSTQTVLLIVTDCTAECTNNPSLSFTCISDSPQVCFSIQTEGTVNNVDTDTIEYSLDNGATWLPYTESQCNEYQRWGHNLLSTPIPYNSDIISITINGTTYTPPAPIPANDSAALNNYFNSLGVGTFQFTLNNYDPITCNYFAPCAEDYRGTGVSIDFDAGARPVTSTQYPYRRVYTCAAVQAIIPGFVCETTSPLCIDTCDQYQVWITDSPSTDIPDTAKIIEIYINGLPYTPGSPIDVNNTAALHAYFNGLGIGLFGFDLAPHPGFLDVYYFGECGITYGGSMKVVFDNGGGATDSDIYYLQDYTCTQVNALSTQPFAPVGWGITCPNQLLARRTTTYTDTCTTDVVEYAIYDVTDCGCYTVENTTTGSISIISTTCAGAENLPPVATRDMVECDCNSGVAINVLANDYDLDGTLDPASVIILVPPTQGTTSINPGTGAITYTPAPNTSGIFSFFYQVSDNTGATANAEVRVTVLPCPTPCNITIGNITTQQCQPNGNVVLVIPFTATNTGTTLTIAADAIAINYNVTAPSGVVMITLAADGSTIPITITDNNDPACTATATYTLPTCPIDPCTACTIELTNVTITPATNLTSHDGEIAFEIVPTGCASPYSISDVIRQPGCYLYQNGSNGTATGLTACDTLITNFIAENAGNPTLQTGANTFVIKGIPYTGSLGNFGTPIAVSVADDDGCLNWLQFYMWPATYTTCTMAVQVQKISGICDANGDYSIAIAIQSLETGTDCTLTINGIVQDAALPYSAGLWTYWSATLNANNGYSGNLTITVTDNTNPACTTTINQPAPC